MSKTRQDYDFGCSLVSIELGDDLAAADAEVLVSSDDHMLSMGGGVSLALVRAGGAAIRDDAGKHSPAALGDVVVSTAGALPARYIFHAITRRKGERASTDAEHNRRVIESATRSCLRKMRSLGLHSIAFPALGAGYAAFEVADVAATMAKVVARELADTPEPPLKVVIVIRPADLTSNLSYNGFFKEFDRGSGLLDHIVRDHAVVMIHGIRTDARWFDSVSTLLRVEDPVLHPISAGYGFFDTLRFLAPFGSFRQRPIRRVKAELTAALSDPRIKRVSVIAHSFGTYIVGAILERDSGMKLHRLILCGSVLPGSFDWLRHGNQVDALSDMDMTTQRIVNDCGWFDIWPVVAESVTWGYGSAGRFGFQTQRVADRFHPSGHGDFFREAFVRDYWVPLLVEGKVRPGPADRPATAWWTQALLVVKLRWILLGLLAWVAWALVT